MRELTQSDNQGYLYVTVFTKDKYQAKSVHRIVAETYLTNEYNLREVDHIDCNKKNNAVSNLEWVSSKENKARARANGLYDATIGESHYFSILTEDTVHKICRCIQDGMRNKEISELFGIHKDWVSHIKLGDIWSHVSKNYKFTIKRTNRKSKEFIEKVCELVKQGFDDGRIVEILDSKITKYDVFRIRTKQNHKIISDSYF